MSLYDPSVPTGTVKLSFDYKSVQNNFSQLDTSFGVDHYKFSDQTADNGFHNQVTTPLIVGGVHPTTTTNPIFYAMQDSANIGTIQYSRGPSNAAPTPVTSLHSPSTPLTMAPGAIINLLDGAGKNFIMVNVFVVDPISIRAFNNVAFYASNLTSWISSLQYSLTFWPDFQFVNSGSILQLKNVSALTFNNVYWTMQIMRIQ